MNKSKEELKSIIRKNICSERVAHLTKALVNLRSDAPPGNEYEASMYLYKAFKALGLEAELQKVAENRFNVIARLKGSGVKQTILLYSGHIDVVPAGNGSLWDTPPFSCTQKGKKLYGRGTSDMKGSIASVLHVLEAIKASQVKLDGDLLIALDVDEEVTNLGMKKILKQGLAADYCIVGEPTNLEIALGHRGVMAIKINVLGRAAHAAQPGQGANAIYKAKEIIDEILTLERRMEETPPNFLGLPTITVTMINGGIKTNVVPDCCEIIVDRRLVPGETKQNCRLQIEQMLEKLKEKDKNFRYSYEITTYCPPALINEDEKIVRVLTKNVAEVLGKAPLLKGFEATCEASLIMEYAQIPTVIFGPGRIEEAHTINEYIEIEQLQKAAEIYASCFVDLLC